MEDKKIRYERNDLLASERKKYRYELQLYKILKKHKII